MKLRNLSLGLVIVGAFMALPSQSHAVVYNLETDPNVIVSTAYGDAIFATEFTRTAGTGVIDPFLTIQASNTESGYNTSAGVLDTTREPQYNHEVQLQDLTKVTLGTTEYYTFIIDVNEPDSAVTSRISLDSLKIYSTSSGTVQTTTNPDDLGTLRFDLGDNTILYDDLNSGSGQFDIAFFIPVAAFAGVAPTDYIYMYQAWGGYNILNRSGGGFEETRFGGDVRPVPEVATVAPLAGMFGLMIGANVLYRRRRSAAN